MAQDLPTANTDQAIVLYDGVCSLCDSSVRFIIDRDPEGYFRFAALQLDVGKELMAACGREPGNVDTLVLIENGQCYDHSTAALRIARQLGQPWEAMSTLLLLPKILRDPLYKGVSRVRYQLFGKKEACSLPAPSQRQRFLDAHLCD